MDRSSSAAIAHFPYPSPACPPAIITTPGGSIGFMPAAKGRKRQAPTPRANQRLLNAWVPSEVHTKAVQAADAGGISIARYLRSLVERDVVDASGLPLWLPPRPDADDQEELPLHKTA